MAWVKKCFTLKDRVFSAGTPEEALGVARGASRAAMASALKEAKETLQVGREMGIYTPSEADEVEMLINNAYKALTVGGEWKPHSKTQETTGHAEAERPGRGYVAGATRSGSYAGDAYTNGYGGQQADPYYWRGGYTGSPYGTREGYDSGREEWEGRRVVRPPTREEVMEMWRRRRAGQERQEERPRYSGDSEWLDNLLVHFVYVIAAPAFAVFYNEWVSWAMGAFGLVAAVIGLLVGLKAYGLTTLPQNQGVLASIFNMVVQRLLSSPTFNHLASMLFGSAPLALFSMLCTLALPAAVKMSMVKVAEKRGYRVGIIHKLLAHFVPSLVGVFTFFLFNFIIWANQIITHYSMGMLMDWGLLYLLINALFVSYFVIKFEYLDCFL